MKPSRPLHQPAPPRHLHPLEPACSTMTAVASNSIVTRELACQAHRNLSFWEPRNPRQLAVYKPSSSVG